MATNFQSLISIPTVQNQIDAFWSYASSVRSSDGTRNLIDRRRITPRSFVYQLVLAFVKGDSMLWSTISQMGAQLTDLSKSSGGWLDILASWYGVTKKGSIATSGTFLVVVTSTVSQLSFTNPASGVVYLSDSGSFTAGTYSLKFTAQTMGPIGNCSLSELVPSSAGYTISTTQTFVSFDDAWIQTPGADPETPDQVKMRCADVIAYQATDPSDCLAAQIRIGTNYAIYRVWVDEPSSVQTGCVVAGKQSTATTAQVALSQTIATKYARPSDMIAVFAASEILVRISGELNFSANTPSSAVTGIIQGLADWINTQPIVTWSSDSMLKLYQVSHKINQLDSTESLNYVTLSCYCQGNYFDKMTDVIIAPSMGIYKADLSMLRITYEAQS